MFYRYHIQQYRDSWPSSQPMMVIYRRQLKYVGKKNVNTYPAAFSSDLGLQKRYFYFPPFFFCGGPEMHK